MPERDIIEVKRSGHLLMKARRGVDGVDGIKYDTQKQRWDLLPLDAVNEVVKRYTFGAQKYGENNWQTLENGKERYLAALLRHLHAWRSGEKEDEEADGLTHVSAVAWNALALVYYDLRESAE